MRTWRPSEEAWTKAKAISSAPRARVTVSLDDLAPTPAQMPRAAQVPSIEAALRDPKRFSMVPPISVVRLSTGSLQIADGYHRVAAARRAGYTHIPAWLVDDSASVALGGLGGVGKTLAALRADLRVKEVWQENDGFCGKHGEKKAADEETARVKRDEAEDRQRQKGRSEDAFIRLRQGSGLEWADKWNAFIQAHVNDDAYRDRAGRDAKYMALYKAVFAAETVPSKRKAIKEFFAYAQKAGFGSALAGRALASLRGSTTRGGDDVKKHLVEAFKAQQRGDYGAADYYFDKAVEAGADAQQVEDHRRAGHEQRDTTKARRDSMNGLAGKGSPFRLTHEVVHTLRRAHPRDWLTLDDVALEAAYERVRGRVVQRMVDNEFRPTDVETWTAEIYNHFSRLNVGGRSRNIARHIDTTDADGRRGERIEHEGPFGPEIGLRLHEAFQLAQACKKTQIASSDGGAYQHDTSRPTRAMGAILVPTMEALGFGVYHAARIEDGAGAVEYVVESDVRPASYSQYGRVLLSYVNTGDTYSSTIGWDHGKETWYFGSWGSWLEHWESDNPEGEQWT